MLIGLRGRLVRRWPVQEMGWRFWIDRGGTFTDLIGLDPGGQLHVRKVLSEQSGAGDPAVSAMEAVLASASPPVDLGDVDDVRLGTTVATNALLEGAGAPLLLLTNAGLRDQLWICLLYTSPSPRDATLSRMPSSA